MKFEFTADEIFIEYEENPTKEEKVLTEKKLYQLAEMELNNLHNGGNVVIKWRWFFQRPIADINSLYSL